jgi:WD40 repeat protein
MVESAKDYLVSQAEVVRDRLEGHKGAVNSLEVYSQSGGEGYLAASYEGVVMSASDDGTALVWDLRNNKRVMIMQDKGTTQGREIVKAKFLNTPNYAVTIFGDSLALFDLRKPAIIVSEASKTFENPSKSGEDLNDLDVCLTATG